MSVCSTGAQAALFFQDFQSEPELIGGIGTWDKHTVEIGESAVEPALVNGAFAGYDTSLMSYDGVGRVLRVNSFSTQYSRNKKLSVLVDTSAAKPGEYTLTFDIGSFTAGDQGTYTDFYLTEGNVNADGAVEYDLGLKSPDDPAASIAVSSGTVNAVSNKISIYESGEVLHHFRLTKAGSPGDFLLLTWVSSDTGGDSVRSTASYTLDNILIEEQLEFPLRSLETGYTMMRVRTGMDVSNSFIVAASYEGTIVRMDFAGEALWTNALSGYMVHDLWCSDLNGDRVDDILVSNADGYLYCLNGATGTQLWNFAPTPGPHKTPMYAGCAVQAANGKKYVACGGFDKNFYWLSSSGQWLETVVSKTYSLDRPWGDYNYVDYGHSVNWVRPLPQADGTDVLVLNGTMAHNVVGGHLYFFQPLASRPYATQEAGGVGAVSDLKVCDPQGDGSYEFFLGGDGLTTDRFGFYDPETGAYNAFTIPGNGPNGYRITQGDVISDEGNTVYLALSGAHINLIPLNLDVDSRETFNGTYAFNDLWKDPVSGKVLLGSAQSGGSCIHILDPSQAGWKTAFMNLKPSGKIQTILNNTATAWDQLNRFTKPAWERDPSDIYINKGDHPVADEVAAHYEWPVLFDGYWHGNHVQTTNWRYEAETYIENDEYRTRDSGIYYDRTEQQVLDAFGSAYAGKETLAYWAGHGNDPNYYSPTVLRQILSAAHAAGTRSIMEWPELQSPDDDFKWQLDNIMYPLGEFCSTNSAWMVFKNKKIFWAADAYLPLWSRMVAGDFADVMVSAMEESSDKTQDLSLIGRIGLWAAGSMNRWGMRTTRDNPSFDRTRQFSYQRLPNHFLRTTVMNLACGAGYCSLSYEDLDYYSILWPLVAKGALFVPKRDEIVSFNPVHLSMVDPDELYRDEGRDGGWTIWYDEQQENDNPLVYSHQNMSWPGAPVTPWDYSRFASGVKDRRQNYIPPWPHGMVLITPAQNGVFADPTAPRGRMADGLHPLYRNLMQEYITDGRDYISSDGMTRYGADSYHTTVSNSIAAAARKLPVTVAGNVGWVCAQTDPYHLRLTLVDGGYLNPKDQVVTVSLNTVSPVAVTDVMSGETFTVSGSTAQIDVPLGLWRFIDIELSEPFFPDNAWGQFASQHGLRGQYDSDEDGDGQLDFGEYALGGNPTNAADPGVVPSFDATRGDLVFSLVGDDSLRACVMTSSNLISGRWITHEVVDVLETDGQMHAYASSVGTTNDLLFIKLNLETKN